MNASDPEGQFVVSGKLKINWAYAPSAGSYFLISVAFLFTWLRPQWWEANIIAYSLVVMLMELAALISSAFIELALNRDMPRGGKTFVVLCIGFVIFMLTAGFGELYRTWMPIVSFWIQLAVKFLHPRPPWKRLNENPFLSPVWLFSVASLVCAGLFAKFFPLPRLGVTARFMLEQSAYDKGVWVDEPHRVVAWGFLYFAVLGSFELIRDSVIQDGRFVLPGISRKLRERIAAWITLVIIASVVAASVHAYVRKEICRLTQPRPSLVLTGYGDAVRCAAFSSDGRTFASGSRGGQIKVWDIVTGGQLSSDSVGAELTAMTMLKDQKTLVVAVDSMQDYGVRLWDTQRRVFLPLLEGFQERRIMSLAVSADGKTLATAETHPEVRLWDLMTGRALPPISIENSAVSGVAFSPSNNILAVSFMRKGVIVVRQPDIAVWNWKDRREIAAFSGHGQFVRCMAFSPDGETLATGSDDKTVRIWHVRLGACVQAFTDLKHPVMSLSYSPDGRLLAAAIGSWGGESSPPSEVRVWNLAGQKEVVRLFMPHLSWTLAFSPDGKFLAVGGGDSDAKEGDVRIWPVAGW